MARATSIYDFHLGGAVSSRPTAEGFEIWADSLIPGQGHLSLEEPQVWQSFRGELSVREYFARPGSYPPFCIARRVDDQLSIHSGLILLSDSREWLAIAAWRRRDLLEVVVIDAVRGHVRARLACAGWFRYHRINCSFSMHACSDFLLVCGAHDGPGAVRYASLNIYKITSTEVSRLRVDGFHTSPEFMGFLEVSSHPAGIVLVRETFPSDESHAEAYDFTEDGLSPPRRLFYWV